MITWVFVPLGLILPDQPNRAVRTCMLRGVGGGAVRLLPIPIAEYLRNILVNRDFYLNFQLTGCPLQPSPHHFGALHRLASFK
jgi:hypothetical protein